MDCSIRVNDANCGMELQAKTQELVTADVLEVSEWEDDDPTIFVMTIAARLQGEFQVTNGYRPTKAPQVMKVTSPIHNHESATCVYKCRSKSD